MRSLVAIGLALVAGALAPAAAQGAGWTVTPGPHRLALWAGLPGPSTTFRLGGDFDGNGKRDLASYDQATGAWTVSLGPGHVVMWAAFAEKTGWASAHVGDFNGDGRDDIAAFHKGSARWWVILGPKHAVLWSDYSPDNEWTLTAAGDFNGDGRDDVAAYHPPSGAWWVTPGQNQPGLVWGTNTTKDNWTHAVSGNFDGDRADELAFLHGPSGRWWMLTAQNKPLLYGDLAPDGGWSQPLAGDVNGDGRDDIATFHAATSRWAVVTGPGQVQPWAALGDIAGRSGWSGSAIADVNGDRRADVLAFNSGASRWWAVTGQNVVALWADLEPDGAFVPGPAGNIDGVGAADVATLYTGNGRPSIITPAPTHVPPPKPRAKGGKRVTITVRGALRVPGGVPIGKACRGWVQLTVASYKRHIATKSTRLRKRCAYKKAIRFSRSKVRNRRITVTVAFAGNRYLRASKARGSLKLKKLGSTKKKKPKPKKR